MTDRRREMIRLLSAVLGGELCSVDALEQWPPIDDPGDDTLMQNAWHSLYHFDVDEDIRTAESGYHERQIQALRVILDALIARESDRN